MKTKKSDINTEINVSPLGIVLFIFFARLAWIMADLCGDWGYEALYQLFN